MLLTNKNYTNIQLNKTTTITLTVNDDGLTNVLLEDEDGIHTVVNAQDISMTISTMSPMQDNE
ncbi:hypothetical protein GCM10007304_30300 [Rhodococcoides trifolii]|uniref:Uncharacterized protein n=1 Tax=Rhodococcoides trifolii TaxID=908250 RepID=A0A917FYF1_9NOCA|nr:hypothetical protein GCM10007304_30300 [Rhodococcus trifolii]